MCKSSGVYNWKDVIPKLVQHMPLHIQMYPTAKSWFRKVIKVTSKTWRPENLWSFPEKLKLIRRKKTTLQILETKSEMQVVHPKALDMTSRFSLSKDVLFGFISVNGPGCSLMFCNNILPVLFNVLCYALGTSLFSTYCILFLVR